MIQPHEVVGRGGVDSLHKLNTQVHILLCRCVLQQRPVVRASASKEQGPSWLLSAQQLLRKVLGSADEGDSLVSVHYCCVHDPPTAGGASRPVTKSSPCTEAAAAMLVPCTPSSDPPPAPSTTISLHCVTGISLQPQHHNRSHCSSAHGHGQR